MDQKTELNSSLIVTWDQVPTYGIENLETKSTFQLVLGSGDGENLYAIFIYQNISLGTLTNFSIGATDGMQRYENVNTDNFMESNKKRLIFVLNADTTSSSNDSRSSTSPATTSDTSSAYGTSIETTLGISNATNPAPQTTTYLCKDN